MRHIPRPELFPHVLTLLKCNPTALLASPGDRRNEVRSTEAARLAVEATVQDQDFEPRTTGKSNCSADTLEDERRDDGRVQAADAVDQGVCRFDGFERFGVGRGPHLLTVRVDVPESLNARGEGFLRAFGEVDVRLAERGQGAREIRVFDCTAVVEIRRCRFARMADGVLTRDHATVREAGGYVVREIADDGGEDGGFGFVDAAHYGEEVDCGFEGAGEETGACEEEVPD